MKLLVCVSGGTLSEALLRQCAKDSHAITAFWVNTGGSSPRELCNSLGVQVIQMQMEFFKKSLEEEGRGPYFPGRNLLILSMAISYASAWGYDGIAVGFCGRGDETSQHSDRSVPFLAMVEAVMGLALPKRLYLHRPFNNWPREDVEKLVEVAPKCAHPIVPEMNPKIPDMSLELPNDAVEDIADANSPRSVGHMLPFIFESEEAYGYVGDKPSFDFVSNQFGSVKGVMESRMKSEPGAGVPLFTPDGQGVSLAEWLGSAAEALVDASMMTLGPSPGHNPGHVGCC